VIKTADSKDQIKNQYLNYYQLDDFIKVIIDAKKYYFTKEERDRLMKLSEEEAFDIVKNDGLKLCFLSKEMQNKERIVLEAVKQSLNCQEVPSLFKRNGLPIKFASEELKNNYNFMLDACKIAGEEALVFLSESLRNDASFIFEACRLTHGKAFKFASNSLKNRQSIIMLAATENRLILKFASKDIKKNEKFLYRLKKTIHNIKHSFKRLKDPSISYETFTESNEESPNKKPNVDRKLLGENFSTEL